jgi:predicted dehydrogenase
VYSNGSKSTFGHQPLGVAVIGLGYWGPNLLRVLADDTDVEVRWICDRDEERLARFHRRYPATLCTTQTRDVLRDPSVDAVVIATPVFTHHELATASLTAGKHTFVEKPLAASSLLADELIALARREDRVLMCGHTFLYSPPVRAIKRMLEAETLGELYFVSASRVNLGPYRRDVSVVWDLAPHDFSILLYWFGETPLKLRATGRAAGKLRRTVLVGSEKMIVYDDGAPEPVRLFDHGIVLGEPESFGEYQLSYRTGDIVSPRMDSCEPLVDELADFRRAIREGRRMDAELHMAREVVRMTEAAERSLNGGGEAVHVNGARSVALREPAA